MAAVETRAAAALAIAMVPIFMSFLSFDELGERLVRVREASSGRTARASQTETASVRCATRMSPWCRSLRRCKGSRLLGSCSMEMQQVRYFVALARTLNFTRAAEQCNVSQPALTRAIQQLEHELGGPLFHRERGNTHLSELGRMMLPYLQTVEESCRAARDQARAVKKLERATLTIGTMCTIGPQLVSNLLVRFRTQHPDVEVQVVDAGGPQMIEMLEKGELEVAIVGVPGDLPESLHQLPVFEERFVIVLPQNHRLVARDEIPAAELDKEPYVSRSDCEVFEPVRKELNGRGVFMRQVFSSPRDD